ncbi:RING-1 protein [Pseudomassariella vexata]|uniref:RING-type E3 ubiquitin transferase n=1 Tax=Pseudomassariella vexata TaxID=1141098 RepID=A0A1Y2E368_9PEZI|nr:RING-1 protein [Pseudomassariella vexata]ORY65988.1 RING-1 protein [Pseudomassariella vexata]
MGNAILSSIFSLANTTNMETAPTPDAFAPTSAPPLASVSPSSQSSPYPFALAPDIIRAHQKDAYFQGVLTNQLTDLHRRLLGARSAHTWTTESRTIADLLYLCLTTLLGNRTLGEEYCDLVQVESETGGALPALPRRATYIAGSILLPYALAKVLPGLRARMRVRLERSLARMKAQDPRKCGSWAYRVRAYVLAHLSSITSPAPVHALNLALFYFSGSYYELAKRVTGLRYVFTRKVGEDSDRAGYEVLGVLLVVQMAVQTYLHIRSTLSNVESRESRERMSYESFNTSLDANAYSTNNALLSSMGTPGGLQTHIDLGAATHTPVLAEPRYDLANEKTLGWIKGSQQRKCTLCLEELKDPAATQCGHVFCWACIGDWVREKPECPLCRRACMGQHILPLRAV